MIWLHAALALLAGSLLAVQVGTNNGLKAQTGHPITAVVISFATGLLAILAVALAIRPPVPSASHMTKAPWWIWLGGTLGVGYIGMAVTFAPKLGAGGWLAVVVTGQILTSVLLDHYGLIGFETHRVSPLRVVGVVLLVAGAVLVLRN